MKRTSPRKTSEAPSALNSVRSAYRAVKHWLDGPGVLPWLANLLLAFVIIKFILYPVLGWIFGTSLPIVAVVSSSMDHSGNQGTVCGVPVSDSYSAKTDYWSTCGAWYAARNISAQEFSEYPFARGFKKGDIMVVLGESRNEISRGDILIFSARENYPVIHRVISEPTTENPYYSTKGDNNPAQISDYVVFDEFGRASRCHSSGQAASCFGGQAVTAQTPGAVRVVDETRIASDQVIGKAVLRIPWLGWIKIWFTDLVLWFAQLFG